jgi:hypothetical protein
MAGDDAFSGRGFELGMLLKALRIDDPIGTVSAHGISGIRSKRPPATSWASLDRGLTTRG